MSIFAKLFTGGAKQLVSEVKDAVDEFHFSGEEKAELSRKFEELILKHEAEIQKEVTSRWQADMSSDDIVSKRVRPAALAFLTVAFVVISCFDGNIGGFQISSKYNSVYESLLLMAYGAYFVGKDARRSVESVVNYKKSKNKE